MHFFTALTTAVLFCHAAIGGPLLASEPSAAGKLTVRGQVLRPDGSPARGAQVTSLDPRRVEDETVRTDNSGRFELRGVFGKACQLHACSDDNRLQATLRVDGPAARTQLATAVELRLASAREHVVTVMSDSCPGSLLSVRKPVAGAHVAAIGFERAFKSTAQTDENGVARLWLPASDPLDELVGWHPDFGIGRVLPGDHALSQERTCMFLIAPDGVQRTIHFVDWNEQPAPAMRVHLVAWASAAGSLDAIGELDAAHFTTDAAGRITVPWLASGSIYMTGGVAHDPHWKLMHINAPATFVVQRLHDVEGRLKLPPNVPGEGFLIGAFGSMNGTYTETIWTRTRCDGSFTLPAASNHGYVICLADAEWASDGWRGMIRLRDGDTPADISLNAYPATRLTARLTRGPDHEPLAQAEFRLSTCMDVVWKDTAGEKQLATADWTRWQRTDATGSVTMSVGRGWHSMELWFPGWTESRRIQVTSQREVEVELHRPREDPRRIELRCTLDGQPYALTPEAEAYSWAAWPYLTLESDFQSNGTLVVTRRESTVHVLVFDPSRRRCGTVTVGADGEQVELPLQPMAQVRGTLVNRHGEVLPNRLVWLEAEREALHVKPKRPSEILATTRAITDESGRFELSNLATNIPLMLRVGQAMPGHPNAREAGTMGDPIADPLDPFSSPSPGTEPRAADFGLRLWSLGRRYFVPGEVRDNVRLELDDGRWKEPDLLEGPPEPPLAERLKAAARDARLVGLNALVVLPGDSNDQANDLLALLFDPDSRPEPHHFFVLRVDDHTVWADGRTIAERGWQRPAPDELVLVALDTAGRTLDAVTLNTRDVYWAAELGCAFMQRHATPARSAEEVLAAAQAEAQRTHRRVWIVEGESSCKACVELRRWLDDHRELLEREYVLVEILAGHHERALSVIDRLQSERDARRRLQINEPWMAITEPDGSVLTTSDGPLGNIGFPTSVEEVRHLREMLAGRSRGLTEAELATLSESIMNREEPPPERR